MNQQNAWKRTENAELDLMDLLNRLWAQWKQILICALVFAILGGGYSCLRNSRDAGTEETVMEEKTELTEKETQDVAAAVALKTEIRGMEEYMENSILMQTDPYHKNKVILLYSIDNAKRTNVQKITESYLSFLVNGGMADALKELDILERDTDKSYLAELLNAYQKTYSSSYQVTADYTAEQELKAESVFYVEITGRDEKMAGKLAEAVRSVLKKYCNTVKETAGSHRLQLLSSEKNVQSDSGLQSQQHDKRTILSSYRDSLRAATDAFNGEQMNLYQQTAGIDKDQEDVLPDVLTESSGISIDYVLAGFFGGVFLYCCISVCQYLFQDTVKSAKEIKRLYTVPLYGQISLKNKPGRKSSEQQDIIGQDQAQLLNRIRLSCKKNRTTNFYAMSDFSMSSQEREYMANLTEQLKSWGIHICTAENVLGDTAVWDELAKTGNVLIVCRIGTTTHRIMDEELCFCEENDIKVTGIMAFL